MNKLLIASILVPSLLLPVTAFAAGKAVDEKLATGPAPAVTIENTRGEIAIEGWQESTVQITGTLDEKAKRLIFTANDDEVRIKVETPKNLRGGVGSNLVIKLPVGASIDVEGVSTDYRVQGVEGDVEVDSVSGDVTVKGARSTLDLEVVSGDIEVTDHSGELYLESVSGDITYAGSPTIIEVESVSGDVELNTEGEVAEIEFENVSGDIDFVGRVAKGVRISAEAVSGDISINTLGSADVEIEVETLSGDITNGLSDDKPEHGEFVGSTLTGRAGKGSGSIEVETISGNVELK